MRPHILVSLSITFEFQHYSPCTRILQVSHSFLSSQYVENTVSPYMTCLFLHLLETYSIGKKLPFNILLIHVFLCLQFFSLPGFFLPHRIFFLSQERAEKYACNILSSRYPVWNFSLFIGGTHGWNNCIECSWILWFSQPSSYTSTSFKPSPSSL